MVMAETLFTFLIMLSMLLILWRTRVPWPAALLVGLPATPWTCAPRDCRYLLPVLLFACLAAGLAFAPARGPSRPEQVLEQQDDLTGQVPGQVG
jgi:hypothetical protein